MRGDCGFVCIVDVTHMGYGIVWVLALCDYMVVVGVRNFGRVYKACLFSGLEVA